METSKLFKWGSATFSILPGLGVMLASVGLPPDYPKALCGGIVEAVGVFTLLYIRIGKGRIASMPTRQVSLLAVTMAGMFVVSMLAYLFLYYSRFVYNIDYDTTLFFPFWYSDALQALIRKAGSRNAAISSYGPDAIRTVIGDASFYLHATKTLLLFLYILLFEWLIIAFGLLEFMEKKR